jgi:hypothetical protein
MPVRARSKNEKYVIVLLESRANRITVITTVLQPNSTEARTRRLSKNLGCNRFQMGQYPGFQIFVKLHNNSKQGNMKHTLLLAAAIVE